MHLQNRKSLRLRDYDYSTQGTYFITICALSRQKLFGIVERTNEIGEARTKLSAYGLIASRQIRQLEEKFVFIRVDHFVIMPNHIHLLLTFTGEAAQQGKTLSDVIGTLKSQITRECWAAGYQQKRVFQNSYYDHVVRNDQDYESIWGYIDGNPQKWAADPYFVE